MASRPQSKAIGGVTPLGVITITANIPIQLIAALGLTDKVYTFSARQLGFSLTAASSGEVYINYGNYPGLDANATVLIVQHGSSASLPLGANVTEGLIDVTQYWIDGTHSGDKVAVYAADASS